MADNVGKDVEKKVDEDWKKRAKEEVSGLDGKDKPAAEPATQPEGSGAADAGEPDELDEEASRKFYESLPPFVRLVSELAIQASIHLGYVDSPVSGKPAKDLKGAQRVLDTLGMLKEKAKGNLDEVEAQYLEEVLYNLRMGFVKEAK